MSTISSSERVERGREDEEEEEEEVEGGAEEDEVEGPSGGDPEVGGAENAADKTGELLGSIPVVNDSEAGNEEEEPVAD